MINQFVGRLLKGVVGGGTIVWMVTAASAAQAATVLSGFATFGNNMAGMEVTANFLGGGSETRIWSSSGTNSGGALGTNWSLTQTGDTFSNSWRFDNTGTGIISLIINAIPGNTVFDIDNPISTPGSANGQTFSVEAGAAPTSFKYSLPIDISVGDLFGVLTLNYQAGFTGSMQFLADTDSGTTDSPVTPIPTPALLPGLIGMGAAVLRKRKEVMTKEVSKA